MVCKLIFLSRRIFFSPSHGLRGFKFFQINCQHLSIRRFIYETFDFWLTLKSQIWQSWAHFPQGSSCLGAEPQLPPSVERVLSGFPQSPPLPPASPVQWPRGRCHVSL